MEYFDIVDEMGNPTGKTIERREAHRNNILHRTAHVWIVRHCGDSIQILLQKRCMEKDSFRGATTYQVPDTYRQVWTIFHLRSGNLKKN